MAKKKRKKKPNVIHRWRRVSQFFFLVALNPVVYQSFEGLRSMGVCFPAMNCWACPAAAFGCPIGAIGQFFVRGAVPFLAIGLMVLAGALVGRMICGWVCPFGLLQDLMNKIPSGRKFRLPKPVSYLKYAILVVMVIWVPLQFGVERTPSRVAGSDFFFCNYCPAGALEAAVPHQLGLGPGAPVAAAAAGAEAEDGADSGLARRAAFFLGSPQMWILYLFLVLFVFFRRPFCRGVCPIGTVFALLNKFSFVRMRVSKSKCKDCKICERACPVDNKIPASPADQDCIRCLECLKSCHRGGPEVGLVSVKPRVDYWE